MNLIHLSTHSVLAKYPLLNNVRIKTIVIVSILQWMIFDEANNMAFLFHYLMFSHGMRRGSTIFQRLQSCIRNLSL